MKDEQFDMDMSQIIIMFDPKHERAPVCPFEWMMNIIAQSQDSMSKQEIDWYSKAMCIVRDDYIEAGGPTYLDMGLTDKELFK